MYANPCELGFCDFALVPFFLDLSDPFLHETIKLVLRDQINIVIGQLSRFEPKLKNEDIDNCPKIIENQDFDV